MRAAFLSNGVGQPVQIIASEAIPYWHEIDLTGREQALAPLLDEERAERFDLLAPPLLRCALVRLGTDRHRLVLTAHHLLMDGWSAAILLRELLTLYARRDRRSQERRRSGITWLGSRHRIARLPWLRGGARSTGWTSRRFSRPAPERETAFPEQFVLEVDDALSHALLQQARAHGLTLATLVQAVWAILLGRLTGRDDVVFGATVSGRPAELPGVDSAVGLFINTLPLRVRLRPATPLLDLLRAVQESQSALVAHGYLGLAEIQALTGLPELFDTLVAFENYPVDRLATEASAEAAGLQLLEVEGRDATHYPLALIAVPGPRLRLQFLYQCDVLDRTGIETLAGRLLRLLNTASAEPTVSIGQLDLLHPTERNRILQEWNDTSRPIAPATLPELFAAQAARRPDAVALVCQGHAPLSYAALDASSNQLAHHLRRLGAGPERIVGVCLERSPEMVATLLGILKSGAAYLPLDPDYPPQRLAATLRDAAVSVLITNSRLLAGLPEAARPAALCLDTNAEQIAREPRHAPAAAATPGHAAYVIYTSGSTGAPKGVVVTHRNVTRLLRATEDIFGFGPDDVGPCSTPTPSTSRSGRCGARSCTAAASSSSPTW